MALLGCAFALLLLTQAPAPSQPPGPLDAAKRHLAEGKLDDVLFDLDGKSFTPADRNGAAIVLAEAARSSLQAGDLVLALQFAQMALRLDANQLLALEVGARTSLRQKQFDPAEAYADRLMAQAPGAGGPRLLRAEIALEEGEWARALELARGADLSGLSHAERERLPVVVQTASRELGEREAARSRVTTLERQLKAPPSRPSARVRAPSTQPQTTLEQEVEARIAQLQGESEARTKTRSRSGLPAVIVYGASWCGKCASVKGWFDSKGIPYVGKDIEKEPEAAEELTAKKRAAGRGGQGGVPWIDVGGHLVHGFDPAELERLFPDIP